MTEQILYHLTTGDARYDALIAALMFLALASVMIGLIDRWETRRQQRVYRDVVASLQPSARLDAAIDSPWQKDGTRRSMPNLPANVLEYPRKKLDPVDEAWQRLQLDGLYLVPGDRKEAR